MLALILVASSFWGKQESLSASCGAPIFSWGLGLGLKVCGMLPLEWSQQDGGKMRWTLEFYGCVLPHTQGRNSVLFPQDWRSLWEPSFTQWGSWLMWPSSPSSAWVYLPWWACSSSRATSRTNVSRFVQPMTPMKCTLGITAIREKVWSELNLVLVYLYK